jgi:hypothetical protein
MSAMNGIPTQRGGGPEAADTDPRRYARRFTQAISRLEETLVGERSPVDRFTLASVIAGLEWASRTPAPPAVLSALTDAALHSALLDWQDATEIRDGRREHEPPREVKRAADAQALGVRFTPPRAGSSRLATRPLWARSRRGARSGPSGHQLVPPSAPPAPTGAVTFVPGGRSRPALDR